MPKQRVSDQVVPNELCPKGHAWKVLGKDYQVWRRTSRAIWWECLFGKSQFEVGCGWRSGKWVGPRKRGFQLNPGQGDFMSKIPVMKAISILGGSAIPSEIIEQTALSYGQVHGVLDRNCRGKHPFLSKGTKVPLVPRGYAHVYKLTSRGEQFVDWAERHMELMSRRESLEQPHGQGVT